MSAVTAGLEQFVQDAGTMINTRNITYFMKLNAFLIGAIGFTVGGLLAALMLLA